MTRASALLLLLLVLAACGKRADPRAPFTGSRIPPGLEHRFYPPEGWAWGLLKTKGIPAMRYGVSAPPSRPRADVVILPAYGEPAEAWFETARDLNRMGYVAWVLEPAGQGGSGRYVLPRDLVHAPSLAPDAEAAQAMIAAVIRRRPTILLASGAGAPTALAALSAGAPVEGLILSAPALSPSPAGETKVSNMRRLGLGRFRAAGGKPWERPGPDDVTLGLTHDARRGQVRLAWQRANPDLRMGGPSWDWRAAFDVAARKARSSPPAMPDSPVLILQPRAGGPAARTLCKRLKACTLQPMGPVGAALELEADEPRRAWLTAVQAFVEARIARFSPPPLAARLAPEG